MVRPISAGHEAVIPISVGPVEIVDQAVCVILGEFSDKSRQIIVLLGREPFEVNPDLHVARWNGKVCDGGLRRETVKNTADEGKKQQK